MNQPDLGKRIAELRKAKGMTQEELVDICNLNVRTLQRIESGEVTPRAYTLRMIFSALDLSLPDSLDVSASGNSLSSRLGQLQFYILDLFNLKTQRMKKITILSISAAAITLGLFAICTDGKAQKAEKVARTIESLQNQGNRWMANGQIDSVLTLYRDDARVIPLYKGKAEIRQMMVEAIKGGYKLIDFQTLSVSVADTIAVQKYADTFEFMGTVVQQEGMTEWRLTKGKWLVVNDIMVNY